MSTAITNIFKETIQQTFVRTTEEFTMGVTEGGVSYPIWPDMLEVESFVLSRIDLSGLEALLNPPSGFSVEDLMSFLTPSEKILFDEAMIDPNNVELFVKVRAAKVQGTKILPGDSNFVEMMTLLVSYNIISQQKALIIQNVLQGMAP